MDFGYYLFILACIVVGIIIIKRVASCLIRSIVLAVILGILAYIYFFVLQ